VAVLADELGVSEDTIRRWEGLDSVEDRPHAAHRQQTTLTPAQELVVVQLRRTLRLPRRTFWWWCGSSFTPRFPVPVSAAACNGMA